MKLIRDKPLVMIVFVFICILIFHSISVSLFNCVSLKLGITFSGYSIFVGFESMLIAQKRLKYRVVESYEFNKGGLSASNEIIFLKITILDADWLKLESKYYFFSLFFPHPEIIIHFLFFEKRAR